MDWISWLPSNFGEIVLVTLTVIIVIIVVNLFIYTSVQSRIKQSRCYRDKVLHRPGVGIFTAYGVDSVSGQKIYEVVYDFAAKTYTVNQVCKRGPVKNSFQIPVYDISTNSPQEITKYFECEISYSDQTIIYTGYPGVVKYMTYNNTDFFDKMVTSGRAE